MSTEQEPEKREIDWGDGTRVTIRKPKLKEIPGDSVICPAPCYPVGEDEKEWKRHERERGQPVRRRGR